MAGTLAAVLLLGACGGSGSASPDVASIDTDAADDESSDGTTATTVDRDEAMLQYAECMRDHGIDMPDPKRTGADEGGVAIEVNGQLDKQEMEEAEKECGPLLEDAVRDIEMDPEQEAEMRQQMLEYTECMRDEGIDMPDPQFSTDGDRMVVTQSKEADSGDGSDGSTPPVTGAVDDAPKMGEIDPEFAAADEKCAQEVGMDRPDGGPALSTREED